MHDDVSVPPRVEELSGLGRRDWTTGIELIRTCMATHGTQTYVVPTRAEFFQLIKCADVTAQGTRARDRTFQNPERQFGGCAECSRGLVHQRRRVRTPCSVSMKRVSAHYGVFYSFGESPPYDARYMLRHVPPYVLVGFSPSPHLPFQTRRTNGADRRP